MRVDDCIHPGGRPELSGDSGPVPRSCPAATQSTDGASLGPAGRGGDPDASLPRPRRPRSPGSIPRRNRIGRIFPRLPAAPASAPPSSPPPDIAPRWPWTERRHCDFSKRAFIAALQDLLARDTRGELQQKLDNCDPGLISALPALALLQEVACGLEEVAAGHIVVRCTLGIFSTIKSQPAVSDTVYALRRANDPATAFARLRAALSVGLLEQTPELADATEVEAACIARLAKNLRSTVFNATRENLAAVTHCAFTEVQASVSVCGA